MGAQVSEPKLGDMRHCALDIIKFASAGWTESELIGGLALALAAKAPLDRSMRLLIAAHLDLETVRNKINGQDSDKDGNA